MSLQRPPAGWTGAQTQALNDLAGAVEAYQTAASAAAILNDATVSGTAVRRDLLACVQEAWDRLCTYSQPPNVPMT